MPRKSLDKIRSVRGIIAPPERKKPSHSVAPSFAPARAHHRAQASPPQTRKKTSGGNPRRAHDGARKDARRHRARHRAASDGGTRNRIARATTYRRRHDRTPNHKRRRRKGGRERGATRRGRGAGGEGRGKTTPPKIPKVCPRPSPPWSTARAHQKCAHRRRRPNQKQTGERARTRAEKDNKPPVAEMGQGEKTLQKRDTELSHDFHISVTKISPCRLQCHTFP